MRHSSLLPYIQSTDANRPRAAEGSVSNPSQEAAEQIKTSDARLQSFVNHSPSLVFIKDMDGRYVHVNDRFTRAFGLDCEDIISHTDAELFSAEVAAQFRANDAKALAAAGGIEVEEVARYGDGTWRTSIVHKFPLLDGNGRVTALGGVVTDITERRRLEEARRQIRPDGTPPMLKRGAPVHLAFATKRAGGAHEVRTGTPPALADHAELITWLDDITTQRDEDLRAALMQTAFLARLTRSAVAEITGRPGVFDALQRLADAGVLVRRDHSTSAILRLDPGFRAHLQELARSTLQPAELSALLWRTTALMEKELEAPQRKATPPTPPAIRICALGGFHILRNGSPLPRHRKAPGKPLSLLKALVALDARGVPSHTLADLLWPEAEGDHADARLTTTLHRTRALLGAAEAILKDSGELSLNRDLVSCDVLEFHDVLQQIETQEHSARESAGLVLKAYPGPLLPACTAEAWLQPCRERLAAKFAGAVARVGRRLESENHRAEAQTLYLEALAREPLAGCLKRFL